MTGPASDSLTDPGDGGFLSPAPPRIFAHRGLAIDAPENTLRSFRNALSLGVTHLETDVHASRDGVAVISHDPDLTRLTGRDIRVGDLTMAELAGIDLGGGERFCSMGEALAAFPTARFNIDIKTRDAVDPTVDAIRQARAGSRVLVTSFSERRRRAAVRQLPGVATSASSAGSALALLLAKVGAVPLVRLVLRRTVALQIPETYWGIRIITPRMLQRFHAAAVEVHVWTVNDPGDMRRLLDLGVDGLITDRADLALRLLAERDLR